jgi:hypothetical protein
MNILCVCVCVCLCGGGDDRLDHLIQTSVLSQVKSSVKNMEFISCIIFVSIQFQFNLLQINLWGRIGCKMKHRIEDIK